jgi:hypothetical protein
MMTQNIKIKMIRIDGNTQPRVKIDTRLVSEYAASMADGAKFPPMDVFHDGVAYWLADGFHRLHAMCKQRIESADVTIHTGTVRDARLFAAGANAIHGLPRTNEDKRASVLLLLADEEWGRWSNCEIARVAKVSEFLVRTIRSKHIATDKDDLTSINRSEEPADEDTADAGDNILTSINRSEGMTDSDTDKTDKTILTTFKRSEKPTPTLPDSDPTPEKTVICRSKHGSLTSMNVSGIGKTKKVYGVAKDAPQSAIQIEKKVDVPVTPEDRMKAMAAIVDDLIKKIKSLSMEMHKSLGFEKNGEGSWEAPKAKMHRYRHTSTVGVLLSLARDLKHDQPVGVDRNGEVVTRYDQQQQEALLR